MTPSLYDKYGGFPVINQLVTKFYEKILDDDSLKGYFGHVDMAKLIDHQTRFLCVVLGGPAEYKGKALSAAHKHLNVTTGAFNQVAVLLTETLQEGGVEKADVETIMGIVAGVKNDIVSDAKA